MKYFVCIWTCWTFISLCWVLLFRVMCWAGATFLQGTFIFTLIVQIIVTAIYIAKKEK